MLPGDEKSVLEAKYNLPFPLIKAIMEDLGEKAESVLMPPRDAREHIRISVKANEEEVLSSIGEYEASSVGGYFVKNNEAVKKCFEKGKLTFQSPSSAKTRFKDELLEKYIPELERRANGRYYLHDKQINDHMRDALKHLLFYKGYKEKDNA